MRSLVAWLLFAIGAAVPAVTLLVVIIYASKSEGVRMRTEQAAERAAAAQGLRSEVELAIWRGKEALRNIPAEATWEEVEAILALEPVPFADAFVVRADGELLVPRRGGPMDVPQGGAP